MLARRISSTLLLALLATSGRAQPAAPVSVESRSGDLSVILHWMENTEADLKGYRVFRSMNGGPFFEPIPTTLRGNHFVDHDVQNDSTYHYFVRAVDTADLQSDDSELVAANPLELSESEFLELVQRTAFDFFWYEANAANGLIRDRSTASSRSSIASVGFGLSAITVAIDRGWISREAGRDRVHTTLDFFWNSPHGPEPDATGYKGFYYHFLDMETGRRSGTTELSTIDTALLLGGVLHVREFFDETDPDEQRIRNLSDSIYQRVDWRWAQVRPPRISHGWRPESGFIPYDWGGYNEAMLVYILALGSPTFPVDTGAWQAWVNTYRWQTHYGHSFVIFPPLFGHQYSHVWVDFRGIADSYMRARSTTYFENSRRATLAQRAYAIDNPGGYTDYGEKVWGFTASDGPDGYRARGAPPPQNDDGTVTPTAAGGSYPFTPQESFEALRYMYDTYRRRLWSRYGFRDAFNPWRDWFASDFIGIDQGPIVLMIENGRTGAVWDRSMQHEAIQVGLSRAGFAPVGTGVESEGPLQALRISSVFPNPASDRVNIEFGTDGRGKVHITVFDVLGRRVESLIDDPDVPGAKVAALDLTHLAQGIYFVTLSDGQSVVAAPLVIQRHK